MIKVVQAFTVPMSLCFLEGQTEFWQQNGIQLHILTSQKKQLLAFAEQHQVKAKPIAFRRSTLSWGHDLVSLCQLLLYFRQHKPKIVHGNTPKAAFLTMLAARMSGVSTRIYEIHGLPLETAGFFGKIGWKIIEKLTCACATKVVPVSHSLSSAILRHGLVNPSKLIVLQQGSCNGINTTHKFNPNRITPADIADIRYRWGLQPHQPIVGFVGRLTADKGIEELYGAWQIVKKYHPNARLMLIGDEDERVKLNKSLKKYIQADESILNLGTIQDLAPYYALMDFLVLPSYREGLGNVVLEAAAMKKPAVVSHVTGLMDAVKDNQTGLFCAAKSVSDLADKMLIYLQNPQLACTHGQAAYERVCEDFVPQNIWCAKLQLYRRLLAATQSVPLPHVSPHFQVAD